MSHTTNIKDLNIIANCLSYEVAQGKKLLFFKQKDLILP